MSGQGRVLGRLDEIEDGKGRRFGDLQDGVIVIRRGDEVFAWQNACPHAGLPLSLPDGRVLVHSGAHIVCPVHGASFDVETGDCNGGPAAGDSLTAVPVRIIDGEIRRA